MHCEEHVVIGLNQRTEMLLLPDTLEEAPMHRIHTEADGERIDLHVYSGRDGVRYLEDIQTSLTVADEKLHFFALKSECGNWIQESLWSREEIEEACENHKNEMSVKDADKDEE